MSGELRPLGLGIGSEFDPDVLLAPDPDARRTPAASDLVVQLVPVMHYRTICRRCGWSGTQWNNRGDADYDVATHECRRASDPSLRSPDSEAPR